MRRLAPSGLGGHLGAELRHGATDFAPNRKDFKHQGRPEHLLWVHVHFKNCRSVLFDLSLDLSLFSLPMREEKFESIHDVLNVGDCRQSSFVGKLIIQGSINPLNR